ncbi:MAG: phosphoribosylamine--glycine ligase [Pseudomonadota bacterium]|nr:phosphoribosylamine--glycine ligase [Gammaproteobacteria bacterium]MEE2684348.1 phosphoribosylamine--glycine ligase [Pseudomonadota bacterium]|tara:strand:- start:5442 stop:6725 length:1284 start_codon:yes stop_codon:yes gene_type:complete
MNVLIIGNGGREHALAWKAAQSSLVSKVLVAPGNAGTLNEPKVRNISLSSYDKESLSHLAKSENVQLTIVGPEQFLVDGIVDHFEEKGLLCFGPNSKAARLEGSKTFTKELLFKNNIPTANYRSFQDSESAIKFLDLIGFPAVIKADGLAAGKGVIIANEKTYAEKVIKEMLNSSKFGEAGKKIVIEEFLRGEEASFIAMVDGKDILPLASSQDHKTRDDGDLGPNTGGMGAYSPAPIITETIHNKIMNEIMRPTIQGLQKEGIYYRGFLYAGLIISNDQPKVIEFNCRLGDPETQPILLRMKSDIVSLCMKSFEGKLGTSKTIWDPMSSLGVVMASGGYPEKYKSGYEISGLNQNQTSDTKIFHAGTKISNSKTITNGGRVLCITTLGDNVSSAQKKAYRLVKKIKWKDSFYRNDIGYRAIERESN